jgi:hypothetical protein
MPAAPAGETKPTPKPQDPIPSPDGQDTGK